MAKSKSIPSGLQNIENIHRFNDNIYFVYFLCDGDEIVYVGQTSILTNRIKTHKPDKEFTDVYYITVQSTKEALRVEAYYIRRFKPKYNKTHCSPPPRQKENLSVSQYLEKNGLSLENAAKDTELTIDDIPRLF